jgi:hypothetical protein
MGVENSLQLLESVYGHVVANRGTENRYAVAIEKVITLIKGGSSTKDAFDKVDKIVEEENRQKSKPQS